MLRQQGRNAEAIFSVPCLCGGEQGYAILLKSWENFYTRRLYHRIQDCWNRPVGSQPGAKILVLERSSTDGNKTLRYAVETVEGWGYGGRGAEKESGIRGTSGYDWGRLCILSRP